MKKKDGSISSALNENGSWISAIIFFIFLIWLIPSPAFAGGESLLISNIGISILAATIFAFLAHLLRQPLLLAYILAGIVIGPKIGLALVSSEADIEVISEIGLILLLFMIGLEIDVKKLRESGRSLIMAGLLQFLLCFFLGAGFLFMLGYSLSSDRFDLLYLAVCCAISSTTIVVKLLYEKFELDTLAGRITLGILVFQDLWAIVVLGIQPNLANPDIINIFLSFAKGGMLVLVSLLISRYFLGSLFRSIAKLPELMLVASLGWCFFICWLAGSLHLSPEMGALIAGVAISTFPYNLDVIAKIVSLRDFFLTLFFVSLGMKIPDPFSDVSILWMALKLSLFLIASRFIAVFPLLYLLGNGNRVSLLVPINLSQMSEFALVIAALGISCNHIGMETLSIIIFVFVFTSITSTYMITYSHALQDFMNRFLQKLGVRDISGIPCESEDRIEKEIALLGFFRIASSFIVDVLKRQKKLEHRAGGKAKALDIKEKLVVIDFNPEVHRKLQKMGVRVIYGDVGSMDTLHHAGIQNVKLVVSTIPDEILKGTDNLKLITQIKKICPRARIIVTAESIESALQMYSEGADYVIVPRMIVSRHLVPVVEALLQGDGEKLRRDEIQKLKSRNEIIK